MFNMTIINITNEATNSPLIKLLKAALAITNATTKAIRIRPRVSGKIIKVITDADMIRPAEIPRRWLPTKGSRTTKKIAEIRNTKNMINKWERVSSVYTILYA